MQVKLVHATHVLRIIFIFILFIYIYLAVTGSMFFQKYFAKLSIKYELEIKH